MGDIIFQQWVGLSENGVPQKYPKNPMIDHHLFRFFPTKSCHLEISAIGLQPAGPSCSSIQRSKSRRCAWSELCLNFFDVICRLAHENGRFWNSPFLGFQKMNLEKTEKQSRKVSPPSLIETPQNLGAPWWLSRQDPTRYETVMNAMPTSSTKRWTLETMDIILEITSFRANWGSRPFVLQPVPVVGYRYSAGEQKMSSSLGRSCCSFSKNLAKGLIKVTGWGVGEVGEPQYSSKEV